jgi:predicted transcriptional regulator
MSIEIPSDPHPFVNQELEAGNYRSEQQLVDSELRMLQRERASTVAGIRAGLADVAAGRVQPLDAAFDEHREELGVKEDQ